MPGRPQMDHAFQLRYHRSARKSETTFSILPTTGMHTEVIATGFRSGMGAVPVSQAERGEC